MAPFEHPYCDADGNIFELQAIVAFLKAFKLNPITGRPQDARSLIKLKFYPNLSDGGGYQCPSLFKPFTKNSHIVAVATTGNVFSYEAIEQLNIKTKNWKDLVDDTPFTRKDLITIQDPGQLEKFNISTFYHIKKKLRVESEEEQLERRDPKGRLKTVSAETKEILDQLERDYRPAEVAAVEDAVVADKFNAAHYSTGAVAASFTSTAMVPVYNHEAAIRDDQEIRYERVKKKGYVRLQTSLGPLNFELFCDVVPKTCENFLRHCQSGYYDGTVFHRSIKNFMVFLWVVGGEASEMQVVFILFCFFRRFKAAIQLALEMVANPFGIRNSMMKLSHNCRIRVVAFCRWPIRVRTQMDHNCKWCMQIQFILIFFT